MPFDSDPFLLIKLTQEMRTIPNEIERIQLISQTINKEKLPLHEI